MPCADLEDLARNTKSPPASCIVKSYLGPTSLVQVASNASVISEALDKAGVPVLDLSRALPSSEFSWPEDGEGAGLS